MDLKQQLQRIQEQLGGLSASQKMLTASLVAIMLMTLVWWARYAATPEMVPVVRSSLGTADLGAIQTALRGAGIPVRIDRDRILVPSDRQPEALVVLGFQNLLPSNVADAWDELVEKSASPFESPDKTSERFKKVKERMLSAGLQQYNPDVISAHVMIESTTQRRIGAGGDIKPSASVFIQARSGADFKRMSSAVATMVAGAQAGLEVDRVSVMINGASYRPRGPGVGMSFSDGELYEQIQSLERMYVEKLRGQVVAHIPEALVTVSVELDTAIREETSTVFDPLKTFTKDTLTETESSETVSQSGTLDEEPGAFANTPLTLENTRASSGSNTTVTEKNRTQSQAFPSQSVTHTRLMPGAPSVVGAAVRLPQSYFVRLWKQRSRSSEEPSDEALQPLIDAELEPLRQQIVRACGLRNDEVVSVGTYFDILPPLAAAVEEIAGPSMALPGMIGTHAKEIAVGSLAMISLVMVMMMVRRGATVPVISTPIELHEVSPLTTDEDIAGEAGEVAAMLDGMELDDETIKAQQMVHQVSTMVKENPEGAAKLVSRWLNRD